MEPDRLAGKGSVVVGPDPRTRSSPPALWEFLESGILFDVAHVVQIGDRGRMVLPAELRRKLGIQAGDLVLLVPEPDGSVRLVRAQSVLDDAMGHYRHAQGTVDEFLRDRKQDWGHK